MFIFNANTVIMYVLDTCIVSLCDLRSFPVCLFPHRVLIANLSPEVDSRRLKSVAVIFYFFFIYFFFYHKLSSMVKSAVVIESVLMCAFSDDNFSIDLLIFTNERRHLLFVMA